MRSVTEMIKKLDWSHGNILAYEASGIMTKEEHAKVFDEIRDIAARYEKVRIFVRLPKMAFPELRAIGIRLKFAKEYLNSIGQYAIVSNNVFIILLSRVWDLFTRIKVRTFSLEDEQLAREWLDADYRIAKKSKMFALLFSIVVVLTLVAGIAGFFQQKAWKGNK
jgi:hypothetical protein